MRPEAAEILRTRSPAQNPSAHCLPHSVARADIHSYAPFKIVQTPGMMGFLYEIDGTHRQVYTDGRKLPRDPQPSWLGYSVRRWQGDARDIAGEGFTDKGWRGSAGPPHREAVRIEDGFHRRDLGHMDPTLTVDDPKMYSKPSRKKVRGVFEADSDILENICLED